MTKRLSSRHQAAIRRTLAAADGRPVARPVESDDNVMVGSRLAIMSSPIAGLRHAAQLNAKQEHVPALVLIQLSSLGGTAMKVFQIRQGAMGAILWTGSAADPIAALDAMAHAAGYYDHSDIPDHLRAGGLNAEEVRL